MKYADDIVKDMDARGPIKVPEDCFASEEFDNYIRRRLAWIRSNSIYGLHTEAAITEIMKRINKV